MSILLAGLPLVTFGLGFLTLANAKPQWRWDQRFLRAVVYTGAYTVLGTELLSLVNGVTRLGLVLLWLTPLMVLTVFWLRRMRRGDSLQLPSMPRLASGPDWILALVLVAFVSTTAVIAYLAPPNTWDSLTYHMSRVAHWAQAGSLRHYATGIERQNLMPPGAEIGMLHAYVLAQGDRLTNFPQWLAMVASLVGAASIARLLGASRIGQLAAAVYIVTLRMGIAQATSTMTDYVVALWVVCAAYETVAFVVDRPTEKANLAALAMAAGLAILTKPTAFAFLAPLAAVVGVVLLRRHGWRALLLSAAMTLVVLLIVDTGYFGRNLATYGQPFGNQRKLVEHRNEIMNWKVVVSNTLRNASLQAATPWREWNELVYRGVIWIHLKLGLGLTDPRTTVHPEFRVGIPTPDEASSGNPFHAAAALVALAVVAISALRGIQKYRGPLLYMCLAAVCFILLSSAFKFSTFGGRYHLAFFALIAPVVGYVVSRSLSSWVLAVLAVALALTSWPWLLELRERPLLADTAGRSVVTSDRQSLYFMLGRGLEEPYRTVTERIQAASCSSVGIMLSGDQAEYPLWPLLGSPRRGIRIEWIVAGTASARYEDPTFQPCAVICDGSCPGDWTSIRDLPLDLEVGGIRLFKKP